MRDFNKVSMVAVNKASIEVGLEADGFKQIKKVSWYDFGTAIFK